jgi:hypothetical protein
VDGGQCITGRGWRQVMTALVSGIQAAEAEAEGERKERKRLPEQLAV